MVQNVTEYYQVWKEIHLKHLQRILEGPKTSGQSLWLPHRFSSTHRESRGKLENTVRYLMMNALDYSFLYYNVQATWKFSWRISARLLNFERRWRILRQFVRWRRVDHQLWRKFISWYLLYSTKILLNKDKLEVCLRAPWQLQWSWSDSCRGRWPPQDCQSSHTCYWGRQVSPNCTKISWALI